METKRTFGETIRNLRKQRNEPLRIVAAYVGIDSTLLSKIERGERFPSQAQIAKFAEYFDTPFDDLNAQVIADKIVSEYGHYPATLRAIKIVNERISPYVEEHE